MTESNARRTTFSFAPPVDDAAAWGIELNDFANRLMQGFPGTETWPLGSQAPHPQEGLGFDMPLGGGAHMEGLVHTPYPKVGAVMALDTTADEAAVLARWLRDHYAPTPDLVHFTSERALELGITAYGRIPATGDLYEISRVLQEHIDTVEA
ncbi:hypothetical protein J3S85_00855 [Streptomyces lavenduligriseus]|uniref:hypothetical protein n=1 Tax=Streptomyces eurythermus TaxID=42237 RepID=UPI0027A64268|nr:hypothetical protein J3S85_00855 [Streptomyces lavenduligriseus]